MQQSPSGYGRGGRNSSARRKKNNNGASASQQTAPRHGNGGGNSKKKGKPGTISAAAIQRLSNQSGPAPVAAVAHETGLFAQYPLDAPLQQLIARKGYERSTPIQHQAIPLVLQGRNIMGIAQTGTGKTGAFLIPIVQQLLHNQQQQVLVLAPTRELAVQIQEEFRSLTENLRLYSAVFIGGTSLHKDLQILQRRQHVVIGTPGRILDLMNRGALRIGSFSTLVLDEFDRMLDMGFINDMERIRQAMTSRKQTLLFSATLDKGQQSDINRFLSNPAMVSISSGETTAARVEQQLLHLKDGESKLNRLSDLLKQPAFSKVIVFTETRHQVKNLCKKLKAIGFKADDIHGDKAQNARQRSIADFSSGRIQVLVATDVAARGLDVNDVSHVINYQLPKTEDSYIHRIGRTGRAGKTGVAITFVEAAES
jgi:ATP-dependent RNA helicase RhlE